ncbi:MAG TPA: polymer-forming cytoskeletal protein [Kiritimatiellia bacterium]|nr:polymer-forming cytoskeletal protein [Kiritimatiellia bacterium]
MAALRKTKEVDGLSLVRAVRHARTGDQGPPPSAQSPPPKPAEPPPKGGKRAARIGHTALPTKNEIHCYECGYAFQSTGRVHSLLCPKCRRTLDQADYTIDAESRAALRTTGNIRLTAGAVHIAGGLQARDIHIAGRIEGGSVKAHRRLTIEAGAQSDPDLLSAQDLAISPGAAIRFRGKREFRSLDVAGELEGDFSVSGLITIRAGGHLKGRIQGLHLAVEDGGGLTAELEIGETAT